MRPLKSGIRILGAKNGISDENAFTMHKLYKFYFIVSCLMLIMCRNMNDNSGFQL